MLSLSVNANLIQSKNDQKQAKKLNIMQVHQKIKTLRESRNFTQEQMGELLNITASGYSKIERGETRIDISRLQQIADIFEVTIFDLMPQGVTINNNSLDNCSNFQNTIQSSNDALHAEIDKLNTIISHKDEIISRQDQELQSLRKVIDLLKNND